MQLHHFPPLGSSESGEICDQLQECSACVRSSKLSIPNALMHAYVQFLIPALIRRGGGGLEDRQMSRCVPTN